MLIHFFVYGLQFLVTQEDTYEYFGSCAQVLSSVMKDSLQLMTSYDLKDFEKICEPLLQWTSQPSVS